jgi:cytochrome c
MTKQILFGLALAGALLGAPAANAQDAAAGESFFKRACAACHTVEAGKNKVGPSLAGVVGRPAGSVEGFAYSPAMKNSGKTWDEASLSDYLKDPKGYIPGNKMAYAGIKKDDDLANVVAYLKTVK